MTVDHQAAEKHDTKSRAMSAKPPRIGWIRMLCIESDFVSNPVLRRAAQNGTGFGARLESGIAVIRGL